MRIGRPGRARLSVRQSPLLRGRFSFQDEVSRTAGILRVRPPTGGTGPNTGRPPRSLSTLDAQPPCDFSHHGRIPCAEGQRAAAIEVRAPLQLRIGSSDSGSGEEIPVEAEEIAACLAEPLQV